jgi:DNA-binding NarL/FixJ family response regulator
MQTSVSKNDRGRIRVMVVDDHPLTRSGVASLVRRNDDMNLCEEAENVEETIEKALRARPDVIVLDLRLGAGARRGIDLAITLAALMPECRLLAYSAYLTEHTIAELRRSGIIGFLPKTAHPEQLARAIRSVAAGDPFIAADFATKFGFGSTLTRAQQDRPGLLTDRELLAIQLLAAGLEDEQIAEKMSLSRSSVRVCLSSAFAKLGARNRTEAVVAAMRLGLVSLD